LQKSRVSNLKKHGNFGNAISSPVVLACVFTYWVVPEKIRTGEKMFLIIGSVLGHPKAVSANFLCRGGMDVFWNEPFFKKCLLLYWKVFFLGGDIFHI
jgi:hypothetical protein